jgi:hypothetical protein
VLEMPDILEMFDLQDRVQSFEKFKTVEMLERF